MKRSSGDGGQLDASSAIAAPSCCPSCKGALLDLRGAAFNAAAVATDGTCVLVTDTDYTCAIEQRRRNQPGRPAASFTTGEPTYTASTSLDHVSVNPRSILRRR